MGSSTRSAAVEVSRTASLESRCVTISLFGNQPDRQGTNLRILYAEKDMITEEHIREMGSLIPRASIKKIRHCNHMTIFYKRDAIQDMKQYLLGEEGSRLTNRCS